ncbi:MAG: FKBP-type peptidyl-prolyl cis-trans isomerase [Bifidobacteriaceae bacterium]|jgi:peptidylprolyl isomerase|nr:FKBP-type peptidyl-prolyl cis-trans isomerase [Bifidobacteriaceae bacterium]
MKRTTIVVAALCGFALMAACADGSSTSVTPTPSPEMSQAEEEPGALAGVTWVDGTPPTLEFETPLHLAEGASVFRVVREGDGPVVDPGDSLLIDCVIVDGADGSMLASTYLGSEPIGYTVTAEAAEGDYVWDAVVGQRQGAQIIIAVTYAAASTATAEVEPTTSVLALTITAVAAGPDGGEVLSRAEGETVTPSSPDLPVVELAADGSPSITIPETLLTSTELVSEVLIRGSGPPLAVGQGVWVHYSGWLTDGTQFDSSWAGTGEPFTFTLGGSVITGWNQGLEGVPVGSQVLLVVPPELGYQDQEMGSIPANSTLIFVVDVLGSA